MSESDWIARAQDAESQISTLKQAYEPAIEKVRAFKSNFGVRERSDGEIVIDFEKFAENLGVEGALELRAVIDEKYQISGNPGEKPRIRLVNA